MYKIVLKPIKVPNNDCCWDGHMVCGYFNSEGGCPECDQGFYIEGRHLKCPQPKPKECQELQKDK